MCLGVHFFNYGEVEHILRTCRYLISFSVNRFFVS